MRHWSKTLIPNLNLVFLESSNVSAVEELTKIMGLSRQFEMNIKVMDTVRNNGNASARILQRNA